MILIGLAETKPCILFFVFYDIIWPKQRGDKQSRKKEPMRKGADETGNVGRWIVYIWSVRGMMLAGAVVFIDLDL